MNVVFVTGNPGKARYFSELIGLEIEHRSANAAEIQDMDIRTVAEFKAKQTYSQLQKPVIVEDTSLKLGYLKGLPGPFIKWFELSVGLEGVCRLADADPKRQARAENAIVYFDGVKTKIFNSGLDGTISNKPKGSTGFGFNSVFIPEGQHQTMAEMTEADFKQVYLKIKPIMELRKFLLEIDKK